MSKFESEPGRCAPARGSIPGGMAQFGPFDPFTRFTPGRWANVWQQGRTVYYRSKLCPRGISAATIPLLRKELSARGIALESSRAYRDHRNMRGKARRAAAKPNDVEAKPDAKPEGNAAARPEAKRKAKRKAKRHAKAKAVGIPDAEGPSGKRCRAQVTDDSAVASSGMHQHIALPSLLRRDARIHGLEEEVDEVKKVKVEVAASEGVPMFQLVRTLSQVEQMARLVPSLAESEQISVAVELAAGSVEQAAAELAKRAFLAVKDGARLAHAALLLLRADVAPRVRICLLTSLRSGCDLLFAKTLPRYWKLFPGLRLHVYVAPAEHEEWLTHFRRHGISEEAGVILRQGGSSPGEQVQAALRDTIPQDNLPRQTNCRLT